MIGVMGFTQEEVTAHVVGLFEQGAFADMEGCEDLTAEMITEAIDAEFAALEQKGEDLTQ